MTRALVSLLAGGVALFATRALLGASIPRAPLRRTNYRGVRVATGLGVLLVAGIMSGAAAVALVYSFRIGSRTLFSFAANAVPVLGAGFGFAVLGLWDDLYGAAGEPERGFRQHLGALRHGRLTGGGLKVLGGAALAILVAAPQATSFAWLLADAATIALFANVYNGFDVRPGRALKFFALAGLPLAVLASGVTPAMSAALGGACAFFPNDLRERAMLGDAGGNALGAIVGTSVVYAAPRPGVLLGVLAGLVLLTALAEGPGFDATIGRIPGLRWFDRAGRVRERSVAA